MQYAVIRVGGKQYKVAKGDTILIDLIPLEKDGILSIDEVMLLGGNGNIKVGRPFVEGAKVKAKVLEHRKGKKIRVAKYKAKVRYRKVSGFRSLQTVVRIEDIQSWSTLTPLTYVKSNGRVKPLSQGVRYGAYKITGSGKGK